MDESVVVVPELPGPLVCVDRGHDELDELIDELLPDTDDGPGPFDIALVVIGAGLTGWAVFAGLPTIVLVIGLITVGLGCVLPARSLFRRLTRRRPAGLPLYVSGQVSRLVRAYDDLLGIAAALPEDRPAVAAAHSALVEVASLLNGRPPASVPEREYVEQRASAIEQLTQALRENHGTIVLLARKELEAFAGYNSLNRTEELAAELRTRNAGE